ncbi:unnamed protein product [Clonostachys rhizophaga]|uniref:Uncharacterized protein n=1 Tax=Clonostachys rhizophaga TaxID=160324 RepID=A0A9N9VHK6_9HYPO|nr:unnamed protein product [Clonostachys rhizophaga]
MDITNISFPTPHVTPEAVTDNILPFYVNINRQRINPQKDCLLFKLSAEIRQQIYDYVFQTEPNKGKKYPLRRSWRRPGFEAPPHVHTNLLQTCSLIYSECWAIPTLNTTMIIHEGSEQDRIPSDPMAAATHPSQLLLGLPAWQVLLLQHVHITLTQFQLENGALESWLSTLHKARSSAGYYVQRFIKQKCFNTPQLQTFAKTGLMDVKIRSLTVRINRQDWWFWDYEPTGKDDDLMSEAEAEDEEPEYILSLPQPPSPYSVKSFDKLHPFANNFQMTFALETWRGKLWELDDIFEAPGPDGEDDTEDKPNFMVWDGKIRQESWEKGKGDHGIWWVTQPEFEEDARKIEVRYIRFVQERFVEPAKNPRKRKWTRPPRIEEF